MTMLLSAIKVEKPNRSFIVNKPFWIIMKQKGFYPYFVAQINNTEFMKTV